MNTYYGLAKWYQRLWTKIDIFMRRIFWRQQVDVSIEYVGVPSEIERKVRQHIADARTIMQQHQDSYEHLQEHINLARPNDVLKK